jgi:hypothetical protein
VHEDTWNTAQAVRVLDELVVAREETSIEEVVALDPGEGERIVVFGETSHPLGIGQQRQSLTLPCAPGARRFDLHCWIGMGEAPVKGCDHVATLVLRDYAGVILECVGKNPARSLLIEPFELRAPQGEDASEHELGHSLGVSLGIGERQGRAPRAAEHLPALDGEVLAQPLDVIDEVPGGVFFQRSVRRRAPAAPLVEQDDAVSCADRDSGRITGLMPPPGPPCSNTAGLPIGEPHSSK